MKSLLITFISLLLIAVFVFDRASAQSASESDRVRLQAQIDKTSIGDTLLLEDRVYNVHEIRIKKPIVLEGRANTTFQSSGMAHTVIVESDSVTIESILFQGAPVAFTEEYSAIYVSKSHKVTIQSNRFYDNFFCIYLAESSNVEIFNNDIKGTIDRESSSGNGIHLWYCKNVTVKDNRIEHQRDGIYFEFVEDSHVINNVSVKNLRYGLHFMFSDNCTYNKNDFIKNGAGVAVMYTDRVEMIENRFVRNNGPNTYGLLLKEISDSKIERNLFEENTTALYLEASVNNELSENEFLNNGWAIRLQANATDNLIHYNNFIANSFDIATNSQKNYNQVVNNYWSNLTPYDLDGDGFSDQSYHPVSLFSVVVENNAQALMLLNSPLINVLNTVERILPVLTPKELVDEQPLLKPVSL